MELIDNINRLLGDDLKQTLKPSARLKIAASCFSIYAFEALKAELEKSTSCNSSLPRRRLPLTRLPTRFARNAKNSTY